MKTFKITCEVIWCIHLYEMQSYTVIKISCLNIQLFRNLTSVSTNCYTFFSEPINNKAAIDYWVECCMCLNHRQSSNLTNEFGGVRKGILSVLILCYNQNDDCLQGQFVRLVSRTTAVIGFINRFQKRCNINK